jgi:hypothetical protein
VNDAMTGELLAGREAAVNELLDHTLDCARCTADREDRCQAGRILMDRLGQAQDAILDAIDETVMLAQAELTLDQRALRGKLNQSPPEPGWSVPDPWAGESHYIRGWGQAACGVKAFYGGERFPAPVGVPCAECVPHAARDLHAR